MQLPWLARRATVREWTDIGQNLDASSAFIAASLAIPSTAIADTFLLGCKLVNGSGFNPRAAYAKLPQDLQAQVIRDAIELGMIGFFAEPLTAWEVNLSADTVISPEESHKVLNITSATESRISATSKLGSDFSLNRINSSLKYTVNVGEFN